MIALATQLDHILNIMKGNGLAFMHSCVPLHCKSQINPVGQYEPNEFIVIL